MDEGVLVTRLEPLVEAEINGELMGLSIERGLCFGFNATATDLWHLIGTPQTLGALCDAMTARHDVDRATCAADLAAVLADMVDRGLVSMTSAR